MHILLTVLVYVAIALYEMPSVLSRKNIREILAFATILAAGLVLGIMQAAGVRLALTPSRVP